MTKTAAETQISADKIAPGKWVPVVNGKRFDFCHYKSKKFAEEVARSYAANGWGN